MGATSAAHTHLTSCAQGDGWHYTHNRGKHFRGHVMQFAPRETLSAAEQAARRMDKVARPTGPGPAKPPALAARQSASPPPAVAAMRQELLAWPGAVGAAATDHEVRTAHDDLRTVEHVAAQLRSLSPPADGAAAVPVRVGDLPLRAYGVFLTSLFKIRARQSVMTDAQRTEWGPYDAYCLAQARADAERSARTARNKALKEMRTFACAWEVTLRSVYCSVFIHTASLRGKVKPGTRELWTDDERTALAQKLYPEAALALVGGFLDHDALRTIGHAATKKKSEEYSFTPPTGGYVQVASLLWRCFESWVRDPACLAKFAFYIDNRSTAYCECFMSKKLKWNPKSSHRTRFYMNGIWCAVSDHNENVGREVTAINWYRGNSLKHPGRWYQRRTRVPTTDTWRLKFRNAMREQARLWSAPAPSVSPPPPSP